MHCVLAGLAIASDALEFDYYADDSYDWAPEAQEDRDSNLLDDKAYYEESLPAVDDLDFAKRSWGRISQQQVDNDRGNRGMPTKFMHEMTQCRGKNTRINLFEHFHCSPDRVEFHDAHFNNSMVSVECVRVDDDDVVRRVRDPCAHFPQRSDVHLCYVRSAQCSTVHGQRIIWMRDIQGDGFSDWYWKRVTLGVGCHCNLELHH